MTPKADTRNVTEDPGLSTDPRDSTYTVSDADELTGQNPPHGQQVEQALGPPQDHDPTPPDPGS